MLRFIIHIEIEVAQNLQLLSPSTFNVGKENQFLKILGARQPEDMRNKFRHKNVKFPQLTS